MKLEEQVVSLELAKRLKELGVKQESLFSWVLSRGTPWSSIPKGAWGLTLDGPEENEPNSTEQVSAFTASELGEMLPQGMWTARNCAGAVCKDFLVHPEHRTDAATEADARALMLIHLIEKGLLKPCPCEEPTTFTDWEDKAMSIKDAKEARYLVQKEGYDVLDRDVGCKRRAEGYLDCLRGPEVTALRSAVDESEFLIGQFIQWFEATNQPPTAFFDLHKTRERNRVVLAQLKESLGEGE